MQGLPITTKVCQQKWGWSVTATVSEEMLCWRESALSCAKQAFLQATEQASCTYLMGKRACPFAPAPGGFTLVLGDIGDGSRACWDVYMAGYCQRGSDCRCLHPENVQHISVTITTELCPTRVTQISSILGKQVQSGAGSVVS